MKSTLFLLTCSIFLNSASAQCDSAFFRYTGTFLKGIDLIDTNRIIGVGDNGYIIKSKDGGKSWKNIKSFTPYLLTTVQMTSDSVGYAAGAYKTILKTEDQGESWFPIVDNSTGGYSHDYSSFTDMYFFNRERGYMTGEDGLLIFTTDGGRNWLNISPFTSDRLNSVTFVNDSLGFICGHSSSLFKTDNGGRTWQKITVSAVGPFEKFLKVRFIDSNNGFIIGFGGLCLKTVDGGTTWALIPTPTSGDYYDIFFQNTLNGIIVGTQSGGLILQTSNGGYSWDAIFNYPARAASYYCIDADPKKKKIVIAGGGEFSEFLGYNGRNILSTTDSGATYKSLSRNGRREYYDVFFLNDSTGYIAGDDRAVIKTSDYGESWKPLQEIPYTGGISPLQKIFFLDTLHGYALSGSIYKTSDGGGTWVKTTDPDVNAAIPQQMYFFDTLKGLARNDGAIYKTINGGKTWDKVANVPDGSFYTDFTATSDGKAFVVGIEGVLDISDNEGTTWTHFNLNTTKYLTSVDFYNDLIGFIGTADTTLFKTTDGGKTWKQINTGIPYLLIKSVRFVNEFTGYMICHNNGGITWIYKTIDGGLSWSYLREESQNLSKISGFKTLYITGGSGLILRTDMPQKPGIPGYISGPDKSCINETSAFSVGAMAGVEYTWTLTNGGTNKYTANKDTVFWSEPGLHTLSVYVSNTCGVSPSRLITTEAIVFEPTIKVQDTVLTATEGLAYQWYRNGGYIQPSEGGNSKSIIAKLSGSYTVDVKSYYGCTVTTPAAILSVPVIKQLCPDGSISLPAYLFATSYQWQRDDGSGFVNISDNSTNSGTNSNFLQLKNIPSAWYGYRFRCVTDAGNSDIYHFQFIDYWNGSIDSAWEKAANWSCGKVPDANTDAIINNAHVIIHSNVSVRKLVLNPTSYLAIQPGNTVTITH